MAPALRRSGSTDSLSYGGQAAYFAKAAKAKERGPTESGEEEVEGFGDAGAARGFGEVAAFLFDLGEDLGDRV